MDQKKNKKCACCGQDSLPPDSEFEICPVCGWEDDDIQNNDPQLEGGANDMSLEQARKEYLRNKS